MGDSNKARWAIGTVNSSRVMYDEVELLLRSMTKGRCQVGVVLAMHIRNRL